MDAISNTSFGVWHRSCDQTVISMVCGASKTKRVLFVLPFSDIDVQGLSSCNDKPTVALQHSVISSFHLRFTVKKTCRKFSLCTHFYVDSAVELFRN